MDHPHQTGYQAAGPGCGKNGEGDADGEKSAQQEQEIGARFHFTPKVSGCLLINQSNSSRVFEIARKAGASEWGDSRIGS